MKGRRGELVVCVSTLASFDDVLVAQRMLSGIVGPRVQLRGFCAGTADLVIRVAEREIPVIVEALRDASGPRFVVAETHRGRIEVWMRDPVRVTPAIAASSAARPLPLQGLTPG